MPSQRPPWACHVRVPDPDAPLLKPSRRCPDWVWNGDWVEAGALAATPELPAVRAFRGPRGALKVLAADDRGDAILWWSGDLDDSVEEQLLAS